MLAKILVVMPTFNERELLASSVASLRNHHPNLDLLIVDDNSPDGTGNIADELAQSPHNYVLHRESKQGLGRAYLAGFQWAKAHGYDAVIEMDADGSHQAKDLQAVLNKLESADLVIGSRWVSGGSVLNWPWYRKSISQAGNLYARTLLRIPVRDVTAGFRAFRMSRLDEMDLSNISAHGYAFQIEMTLAVLRSGGVVAEVPITFIERTSGRSKMTTAIVLEALWLVTKWAFYRSA